MIYFNAFLFAGTICLLGQIILDNTTLTPGHITSLLVVTGAFLDVFDIYDKIVLWAGGGALVPITSFGHLLTHGVMTDVGDVGPIGIFTGMFDLTAAGIVSAIIFSFVFSLIFKSQN